MANNYQHDELKFLYDVSVKDIEFFKKQQWLVTYYAVLVYGALIALANLKVVHKAVLSLAAVLAAFLCAVLLAKLEHSIHVRRERLRAVRSHFTQAFNEAWGSKEKEREFCIVLLCLLLGAILGVVVTVLAIQNAT